jgi:tight adherence protein C
MEQLADILRSVLANPQDQRFLFVLLVAGTIFIFALGLSFVFLGVTDPIRRRLGEYDDEDHTARRRLVTIESLTGPIAHWVMPKSEAEKSATRKKLTYAGIRAPNAVQTFYGIKFLLIISLPVIIMLGAQWMPQITPFNILVSALIAAAVGMVLPNIVLERMVDRRINKLRNAFPDALDLLVVCVESGLGLAAAIQRVSDELEVSHPELALELALVNAEIRAGVDRTRALKNFADRSGLDDIRGLVSLLVQTMRFGTSVADALRIYSEEFRDRRMQKAEERAAKIGTKLIFPLVLCLFPSFFTVAIGPAVLRLIQVFAIMSAGTDGN